MNAPGRPRRVTDEMIVDAGARIGVATLTVAGIAAALGVSEMTIYRRTGGIDGLTRFVAEGIVARQPIVVPADDDPEQALVVAARTLRTFVRANPGIAIHLANLGPGAPVTLQRIDESQRAFAERFGWSPAHASILLSVMAEHAIALAELNPTSHRRPRTPGRLPEHLEAIRAGAEAAAGLGPEERFEWSMRATIRGAMGMLGLNSTSRPNPSQGVPDD